MKNSRISKYLLIIAAIVFFFTGFSKDLFAGPGKHALIIAIGNYDRTVTGWSPISSGNDIPLIKTAL